MKQLFDGVFSDGKNLYTKNLLVGNKVYGEKLVKDDGVEYRQWDYHRSKYAAGLKNGLKESIFASGSKVLYLGSAEGTTISHVSDIVGEKGVVFGVDISEIAMMKLMALAEKRQNILPIVADAQNVKDYSEFLEDGIDALFQDVSQRNQAEIFVRNAQFLKVGGLGALSLKTKSISQANKKEDILADEKKLLLEVFDILQVVSLEPFEKHHYLILVRKK